MKLKKGKFLGAIVLSLFLLSSCKSLKNTNTLFLSEYDKFADTAQTVYVVNGSTETSYNNYKIKQYDLIAIKNLQNPEGPVSKGVSEDGQAAVTFRVNKDGIIILPAIGEVNINGFTRIEAAEKIQKLYSDKLFKNPIIDVSIINNKATVLGEVNRPGNFILDRENIDLIELIGRANGLTPNADGAKIKIIRGNLQNPEIIYVNLKNIKSLSSNKLILQNNDIIYITPKSLYNFSEGAKSYSGIIQPALILLNAALLIYTLGR